MFLRWTVETDIVSFAALLQTDEAGSWMNVELFDCSHSGQNDRHRYRRDGEKGPAEYFHAGTPGDAFRDAIALIRTDFERMIEQWRR